MKGWMQVEIRKSKTTDLEAMQAIYADARAFMVAAGNPGQWLDGYPKRTLLEADIEIGHSYVCLEDEEVVGAFYFAVEEEPTYARIDDGEWLNDAPYGVVHRIAAARGKRGVATFCLNWCYEQCGNMRIDTHHDNLPMQNLLKKLGYQPCGTVYMENGDKRIAFQKS